MPDNLECGRCRRKFRTLTDFDAHQVRDYSRRYPQDIVCADPGEQGRVQDPGGTWCTPQGLRARQRLATRAAGWSRRPPPATGS